MSFFLNILEVFLKGKIVFWKALGSGNRFWVNLRGKAIPVVLFAAGRDHHPLNGVSQLLHVSRPGILRSLAKASSVKPMGFD